MESMVEILNECLKDSNLETVSKAELRKKYLKKTGLTKLPNKDKELFASAVHAAYLNNIANKTTTSDKTNIDKDSNDAIEENSKDWKLVMSSSSDDEITPANIKVHVIDAQFTNGKNDIKETFGCEIKENGEHEKLKMNYSPGDNISTGNIEENVIDDQFKNGVYDIQMESSSDFDEKSLTSLKNDSKKPPLVSTLNGFKRQRGKRTLISSSEDETIQLKPTKSNKVLKKARRSGDLQAEPISKSEEKEKVSKSIKYQNGFKKALVESSDSEDEPLRVFQKKSNSFSGLRADSLTKSDESENECLSKFARKQSSNPVDSEDESIMSSTKKKAKFAFDHKIHSSDSEDEPLMIFKKSNKSLHSNGGKTRFEAKLKSNNNSSDSEDEPLTKYGKFNDSIRSDINSNSFTKKELNSSNKLAKSVENTSGSEDESLTKYEKKKVDNSFASSDSEDEPLNKLSNKKVDSFNDSRKKQMKKVVKGKVEHSSKKLLTNSKSKKESLKKKRFVDSDDDSEEQAIATFVKKSDPVNSSLKSVKNSSDSDDEPLNNLTYKKTNNSNNSEKEPVKNNVKGKVKHSLKKHVPNNKAKEQTLKKKRFVDSDDDNVDANLSSRKKEKLLDGQRDSLLSDPCEDEPLSNIRKEPNNSSDSEDDASISNQKKEKSLSEQKNSLLSDSSEDEPLSNIKKKANSSSDSEDEPLKKLSTKISDKKQKNSESGSSSFVDENDEQSSKKNKPSKRKEACDSRKPGKKRPSASENKIEHLKKYLRVAGIRITNYNKLFENCKSMKAKCEKMMSLLEKEGLKGRPTLEKCKKLRVKIETKREIAELDVSNILKEGGGRPKRSVCSDTTNCKQEEEKSTPIQKFSRLKGIVDSEESD